MTSYFVTQFKIKDRKVWQEELEVQGGTDLQTAREFRDRMRGGGYDTRIVQRTDIVVD